MPDMMNTATTGTRSLILGTMLLASGLSHANLTETASTGHACDSPAPSLVQLGEEQYYNLAPGRASLTAREIKQLGDFYDRLEGRWQGKWTDQYCLGGDLQSNSREFRKVNVNVRNHGQLSFRADGLMIDLAAASELASLEIVDKDSVVMTLRYQRGTVPKHEQSAKHPSDAQADSKRTYKHPRQSALRERHDTLTLLGKELRLETKWYINGFYSGSELTKLSKVR